MNIKLSLMCVVACVCVTTAAVLSPETPVSPGTALSPETSPSPGSSLSPDAAFNRAMRELQQRAMMPNERLCLAPAVLADLQDALRTEWPGCWVEQFGSAVLRLALRSSDLDVSVALPPGETPFTQLLSQARRVLARTPLFKNIQIIPAQYPFLTTIHVPTNFPIDMFFRNTLSINETHVKRYFFELDERARNFALITKCLIDPNRSKKNREGRGITSKYDLVMLSIFFLQQKGILPSVYALQRCAVPYWVGAWNAGFDEVEFAGGDDTPLYELVGQFFEYYSAFDFERFVVSVFAGRSVAKSAFADPDALPAEFALYAHNVARGAPPLDTTGAVVQDMFAHNVRSVHHLHGSMFTAGAQYYRTLDSVQFFNKIVLC